MSVSVRAFHIICDFCACRVLTEQANIAQIQSCTASVECQTSGFKELLCLRKHCLSSASRLLRMPLAVLDMCGAFLWSDRKRRLEACHEANYIRRLLGQCLGCCCTFQHFCMSKFHFFAYLASRFVAGLRELCSASLFFWGTSFYEDRCEKDECMMHVRPWPTRTCFCVQSLTFI